MQNHSIWLTQQEISLLTTWPEGWNGYDACSPDKEAIQHAVNWVISFYLEIVRLHLNWFAPTVTAEATGDVVLTWRHGVKNLAIYIERQNIAYIKDWGANMDTEMEDGHITSMSIELDLWEWLIQQFYLVLL